MNRSSENLPVPQPARLRPWGSGRLLLAMLAAAAAIHVAVLVAFTPTLFRADHDSPERLYERGEAELARGRYAEAIAFFQKVLDLQPKLPPIFEKAAEQHKLAERLQRQQLARAAAATREAAGPDEAVPGAGREQPPAAVPPRDTRAPAAATRPAGEPFIPPELRPK